MKTGPRKGTEWKLLKAQDWFCFFGFVHGCIQYAWLPSDIWRLINSQAQGRTPSARLGARDGRHGVGGAAGPDRTALEPTAGLRSQVQRGGVRTTAEFVTRVT